MGTPVQVKKQVAEAEQLARELGMDGVEPVEAEAPTDEGTPPETVTEPAPVEGTTNVVEIEATNEAPAEPAPEPPAEDWQQKFKTLQGKYNAEVGTLTDELRNMRDTLNGQSATLAALQQAPAPAAEPEPEAAPAAVITETEISDFGPDLLDVVGRKALVTLQPVIDGLMERIHKLENGMGSVAETTLKSAQEKVYDALDNWGAKQTPGADWRAINSSNEFKAWLQEADPFAGELRGALLMDAFNRNDAGRVVAFFTGYLKEQTTVTPGAQPTPTETTPAEPEPTAQVDLETLVQPGGSLEVNPASAHGDSVGRTFTNAEVAQFYSDVQKGKYRGKEAEKDKLEKAIHDAAMTGRVTN